MIVKSSQTLVSSSGSQSRHDNDRDWLGPDELWLSLAICFCFVVWQHLPISGVESVIGSMSPTIVEKIVIASRIVTPDK